MNFQKYSLKSVLVCFFYTLLFAPQVMAEQEKLRWCLDSYPSRHEFTADGVIGPGVNFMKEVSKKAELALVMSEDTPFSRCLRLMKNGKQDVMLGLLLTQERLQYLHMVPLYTGLTEKLFYVINNKNDLFELSDVKGFIIATVRGYAFNTTDFETIKAHNDLVEIKSIEDGLAMLNVGHVDYVLAPKFSTQAIILSTPEYRHRIVNTSVQLNSNQDKFVYIAISKTSSISSVAKQKLEDAVNDLRQTGELDTLLFSLTP